MSQYLTFFQKWTKRVFFISTFSAVGVCSYWYKYNEGMARSMRFCAMMTPMWWGYYRASGKSEEEKRALHRYYAPELLRIILKMRGYYIKAAQMCVGADILPEEYNEVLKILLDEVPPRDPKTIIEIIESELDRPISSVFTFFDEKALAAASIGQVHRAVLHDGTKIVVKV